MSSSHAAPTVTQASRDAAPAPDYYEDDDRGYGWVAFAGTLLLLIGCVNVIEGIAAIGNANFFTHNTHYVFANLNTWGWIVLILGSCQILVGFGVFVKNQFSRWVGVVCAGCQHDRAVADDAGVSVLVADADRDGHPGDLRVDRLRKADRGSVIEAVLSVRARCGTPCSSAHEDGVRLPVASRTPAVRTPV